MNPLTKTIVIRPHPSGGFTHATPVGVGTARIYRGWWPSRPAAKAALKKKEPS